MLNLRYTSETEMYKTMITARDEQLKKDSKKDKTESETEYYTLCCFHQLRPPAGK